MFDLTRKTAIVTGSSRGIGKAIATALAIQGANVVVSSRNQAACEEAAAEINSKSAGKALPVAMNIGRKEDIDHLCDTATREFGFVHTLVCNAASNPYHGPMAGITDEKFEKIFRNNVMSSHWMVQRLAPSMANRGDGSIILISSIGGYRGSAAIGAYNVSKAADLQLARNLAVELGPTGVRVNCIAPGLVRTDFARALWEDDANRQSALQGTPLGRIAEPEDIAGAAVFLASDASRFITGQSILVDGGASITAGGI